MSQSESLSQNEKERELILQREIPFSRELVWQALTDPKHIDHWWGPDGFKNENSVMDFAVGGTWTFEMVAPDGSRFSNQVIYKDIIPFEKIVFDHGDGSRIWFEVTITLTATEKGTLLSIRDLFPTRQERDDVVEKYGAIEGGKQHLTNLENYIAEHLQ